jgi:(p)ppGpp synthase/HD superfamily hydrolase
VFRDLRNDAFARQIYLFTPAGDIRFLPEGSTAIDFAFAIHSEIGEHCSGARVDGKLYPLSKPLSSGAQVEITTDRNTSPRPDWLQHVRSTKARSRIRAFLAQQDEEGRASEGWELLREALRDQNMRPLADNLFESLERAGYDDPEEAGRRALRNRALLREIVRKMVRASGYVRPAPRREESEDEIEVAGMQGVLVRRAGCCSPLPGSSIIGYVSLGRGVSVHRSSCPSVETWRQDAPERLVEASWPDASVVLRVSFSLWRKECSLFEAISSLEGHGDEVESLRSSGEGGRLQIKAEVRLARRENEELLRASLASLPGLIDLDINS